MQPNINNLLYEIYHNKQYCLTELHSVYKSNMKIINEQQYSKFTVFFGINNQTFVQFDCEHSNRSMMANGP